MYYSFYSPSTEKAYSVSQVISTYGIDPTNIDPAVLNAAYGLYPVEPAPAPVYDANLYAATATYTLVPPLAQVSWTYTPVPLSFAKEVAPVEAKSQANAALDETVCNCGFSNELLTAVASQDPLARPARYQAELDEMTAVTDQLDANLTTIDNATTVDEINCVVNGASGIMVTGRGGASADDMQPSYFTDLQGLPPGVGEPELEIYIPGTDTVIPYDAGLPDPYKFDSAGECYNTGDYRTTIRVAATGQVLSTVYPAEGPAVPVAWTYNPVIPSLGGSSSHSA